MTIPTLIIIGFLLAVIISITHKKKHDDFNEEVSFATPKPVSLESDRLRICPYCNNEFFAHHKLQKYCPKKYNKRDYCKNRMKSITNNK